MELSTGLLEFTEPHFIQLLQKKVKMELELQQLQYFIGLKELWIGTHNTMLRIIITNQAGRIRP